MTNAFAASLLAMRELGARRAVIDLRERAHGVDALAVDFEALFREARRGSVRAREASVAVASWIALRASASPSALDSVRLAATRAGLELAGPILEGGAATKALAPGGRLAEVSIDPRKSFVVPFRDRPSERLMFYGTGWGFQNRERFRMHHDPIMIERVLDESWTRLDDVLVIASRRPLVPPMSWAIATRDRWFCRGRVREALAANPFTPAELVLALLPSTSSATIRALVRRGPSAVQRGARLFA